MNAMAWIGALGFVLTLLLTWNRGAHRLPMPSPDPLVRVRDGLGEIWVRESEAWRWR